MGTLIVIEFVTLDGVVDDPDGSQGTPGGGWAFRSGPEAVAGDKFALGEVLETATLLLGRGTWQLFSRLWPHRADPFSSALNAMPKLVASRTLTDVDAWQNSTVLAGDLVTEAKRLREERDVVVTGSHDVVVQLAEADLVDQYRTLVFPLVLGHGRRLFSRPLDLRLVSVEPAGQAVRMVHDVVRA